MRPILACLLVGLAVPAPAEAQLAPLPQLLTPRSFAALPAARPDQVVRYGEAEVQQAELFLPRVDPAAPDALRPVVVLIHGGCWISTTAGREQMRAAAGAFLDKGLAVWNIGYRRVDEPGGGYPGTFEDVAKAIDLLREQATEHKLDLSRVVFFGHSAGGHLALWAAGRPRLPADSPLKTADPLRPRAVISVGGLGDLKGYGDQICGPDTLARLIGTAAPPAAAPTPAEGSPTPGGDAPISAEGSPPPAPRTNPFSDTSPAELLPLGVPIVMLHGIYDPLTYPAIGLSFAAQARKAGDKAEIQLAPNAGHFEVIVPGTAAFAQALAAVERFTK
jgi:acetyl esterase/lipase